MLSLQTRLCIIHRCARCMIFCFLAYPAPGIKSKFCSHFSAAYDLFMVYKVPIFLWNFRLESNLGLLRNRLLDEKFFVLSWFSIYFGLVPLIIKFLGKIWIWFLSGNNSCRGINFPEKNQILFFHWFFDYRRTSFAKNFKMTINYGTLGCILTYYPWNHTHLEDTHTAINCL